MSSFPLRNAASPCSLASKSVRAQPSAKQLVAKPDAIGVDDIGLAVIGDLLDFAVLKVAMHLAAVDAVGLPGQPHNLADFVQRRLALHAEG